MATVEKLETISLDAGLIVAGHFAFGTKTTLTFQTPWNLTERAAAALAEAVAAGVLSLEIGDMGLYAHTYRLVEPLDGLLGWMRRNVDSAKGFPIMVSEDRRQERPPSSWPVPAGRKRHPA